MADITESVAVPTATGRVVTQRLHKDLGGGITGQQLVVVNPDGSAITAVPLSAATPSLQTALGAKVLLKGGLGRLLAYEAYNPNATDAYIQVFDAATVLAVTLGTTPPTLVFWIPGTGSNANSWPTGFSFATGIVVAATTTATGAVLVGTGLLADFGYS